MIRVTLICNLILEAVNNPNSSTHLISVDEKTGIQALERIAPGQPMKPGQPRRIEYEYSRNGTTCLMAAQNVGNGEVLHIRLHPTRKEKDFLAFIQKAEAKLPKEDWLIFLADQLNTHMSVSLVKWVAKEIGFEGDLGTPRYKGILRSMASRKAFLEDPSHRIRFVYTPKHCSWLNPIENWFGKLERHVIKYGSFSSVKELESKIIAYVEFYNRCLCKPLKWKFRGLRKKIVAQELRS